MSEKHFIIGAHGMANGLHILMEAAKMVGELGYDDIEFRLVGDGPEKQKILELLQKYSRFGGQISKSHKGNR